MIELPIELWSLIVSKYDNDLVQVACWMRVSRLFYQIGQEIVNRGYGFHLSSKMNEYIVQFHYVTSKYAWFKIN